MAGVIGFLIGRPDAESLAKNSKNSSAETKTAAQASKTDGDRTGARNSLPTGPSWKDRWEAALARSNNPARTRELAALIEELARSDHEGALALTAANENWRIRDILRSAALRGWASTEPEAAGDYALGLRVEDRRAAVAAVLQGTVAEPEETVRLALRLCEADPGPAGDYGHAAIAALVDAGAFADAVKFGEQVGTDTHPFLLKSAFFQWSRNQPAEALAACEAMEDPVLKARARGEVISGWAWADPSGLARHAMDLSSDADRKSALSEALPLWMEREPEAAINWINEHNSGSEFDAGYAAAANLQSFVQNAPETAMNLAGRVSDSALRSQTMRGVFRQWALEDLDAARAYATSNQNAEDRKALEAEIADLLPEARQ